MTTFDNHERARWAGQAAAYRDSFAALCAHPAGALLDAGQVRAGGRLLDVGTGTGTVAALAYTRGVKVVAVDAEPSMVEATRRRIPDARVHHATLPDLPFDDGVFDTVVANFVVNHVGDPLAAVSEMRRVTRPGGRVSVTIWPYPAPPAQHLWSTVFDAAGVERPTDLPRLPPDRDFPRTAAGLSDLLHRAGLTDISGETLSWTHRTTPDAWWSGPANGIGTPGLIMKRQTPETITRIRARYDEHVTPYREPDGRLALPTTALLAAGRA
ncbi:class I SAM-dependent methyltransferase [Actinoplanes derwentensis]|uniref:Ubiquinone/menaquinone biosynthesis C-methylase UbiE n=1 Tax=Actinoplanes derwentensis TaxID=113562 RepID=A0A1H1VWT3_9ACTN|nr:class I SAM-dependent methyltransferase [Actinoplanes derwentensis]GID83956.1 methyltransferase [Actinoplanes derwentensis]SDS88716.1 Ubiquinone/menaquinone biosynthesis C-methylase UbiE [Actinoplanes derwentensis]